MFRSKNKTLKIIFNNNISKKIFKIDSNMWRMKHNMDVNMFWDTLGQFYSFPICIIESFATKQKFEVLFKDSNGKLGEVHFSATHVEVIIGNELEKKIYKYSIMKDKKIVLSKLNIEYGKISVICRYFKNKMLLNIQFLEYEIRILKSCYDTGEKVLEQLVKNINEEMILDSKLVLKLVFQEENYIDYETILIKTFFKKKLYSKIDIKEGILNSYGYSIENAEFIDTGLNGISTEFFLSQKASK